MGKTRRNRVMAALGTGGVLVAVLSAAGPAALAQPASVQAPSLPKACVADEALVSDGASGPGLGGEVLRVTPGGQSILTNNTVPLGGPGLDAPSDMAFLANGDIAITDQGFTFGRPAVVEVDKSTGARTLISNLVTGKRTLLSSNALPAGGEQFDTPIDVQYNACEKAFYVLQTGFTPAAPAGRVLKVDATSGARTLFATYLGAENYALLLRPIPVPIP